MREIFNNADDINIESMTQLNKAYLLRACIEETWSMKAGFGLPRVLSKHLNWNPKIKMVRMIIIHYQNEQVSTLMHEECAKLGWKTSNSLDIENYLDHDGKFAKIL